MRYLIALAAGVFATDLHRAVHLNDTDSVESLIKAGTPIDTTDKRLRTPLHLASALHDETVIDTLLAAGATIGARDDKGGTPLHIAAALGNLRAISALASAGAPLDAQDVMHMTPLHVAAIKGQQGAVQSLLSHGASVDARDDTKSTPLHLAAMVGDLPVIQTLLAANASVWALEHMNHNAVHAALERGHSEAQQVLLSWMAKETSELTSWMDAVGLDEQEGRTLQTLRKIGIFRLADIPSQQGLSDEELFRPLYQPVSWFHRWFGGHARRPCEPDCGAILPAIHAALHHLPLPTPPADADEPKQEL